MDEAQPQRQPNGDAGTPNDSESRLAPGPWIISIVCLILLGAHIALRSYYGTMKDGFDAITLGLAIVGLSPWIATILKSIKVGGVEVEFLRQRVNEQERHIEQQGKALDEQQRIINDLVIYSLAGQPFEILQKIEDGQEYIYIMTTARTTTSKDGRIFCSTMD